MTFNNAALSYSDNTVLNRTKTNSAREWNSTLAGASQAKLSASQFSVHGNAVPQKSPVFAVKNLDGTYSVTLTRVINGKKEAIQIHLSTEIAQKAIAMGAFHIDGGPGDPSKLKSFFYGFVQGGTCGAADEIYAAYKWMIGSGSYKDNLKAARAEFDTAKKAHPNWYTAGDVAGTVLIGSVTMGAAAEVATLTRIAKVGQYAAKGAKLGAVNGYFRSEGTPKQRIIAATKGAAVGAATSAVAGPVLEKVGKVIISTVKKAAKKVVDVVVRATKAEEKTGFATNPTASSAPAPAIYSETTPPAPVPIVTARPPADGAAGAIPLEDNLQAHDVPTTPTPGALAGIKKDDIISQRVVGKCTRLSYVIQDIIRNAKVTDDRTRLTLYKIIVDDMRLQNPDLPEQYFSTMGDNFLPENFLLKYYKFTVNPATNITDAISLQINGDLPYTASILKTNVRYETEFNASEYKPLIDLSGDNARTFDPNKFVPLGDGADVKIQRTIAGESTRYLNATDIETTRFTITHPDFKKCDISYMRALGDPTVTIRINEVDAAITRNGTGRKFFTGLAERAIESSQPIDKITLRATYADIPNKTSSYGALAWPKYGFDGVLPKLTPWYASVPESLKGYNTLRELLNTEEGYKFWYGDVEAGLPPHATAMDMEFDFTKGSSSFKTLSSYLSEKGVPIPAWLIEAAN